MPVIAIAGTIGEDARVNLEHGIDAFASILETPTNLQKAIDNASELLSNTAERTIRLLIVGQKLCA